MNHTLDFTHFLNKEEVFDIHCFDHHIKLVKLEDQLQSSQISQKPIAYKIKQQK